MCIRDRLTNEVAAETDGVLLKIVAQEGADVPVKGLLGYICLLYTSRCV